MPDNEFNHYEYAKIKSSELWRFYIDVCRQNTEEGKAKGRELFEDEKGYMDGMMRAHRFLNKEWHKDLNAEFILNLHGAAVVDVQNSEPYMRGPLIDNEYILKFKNNKVGGFPLLTEHASINGLVEWLDKIITGIIPYATPQKNYTLAKKGSDRLPEEIMYVYTDMLYEELKSYTLSNVSEPIKKLSSEINMFPGKLSEVELERANEEKRVRALEKKAQEAGEKYRASKGDAIETRNKLRDEHRHLLEQANWDYLSALGDKLTDLNCELRDKTVLLNRMTTK